MRLVPFYPEKETGPRDWARESGDWLHSMSQRERKHRLHDVLFRGAKALELVCGCDQVGTLKLLCDTKGRVVKQVQRDSFGVQYNDSLPDLFMPIGFGGGLADPDTGLVHFGYRDYDSSVGRFTAPDPLGDTGGDHDVYDYCIDDPVTMNDPSGLLPPLLFFLGGKALALGIATLGAYGSAWITDTLKKFRGGDDSPGAIDGMNTVAPKVALASLASAAPGEVVAAPSILATASAAEAYVGSAILASPHADKIVRVMPHVQDFLEGAIVPGPPPVTPAGVLGHAAGKAKEKLFDK